MERTRRPSDGTLFHTYRFPVAVNVLEGAFIMDMEGREPVTVKAGKAMMMPPQVKMTGYNRSSTDPLRLVAFYVSDPDTPSLTPYIGHQRSQRASHTCCAYRRVMPSAMLLGGRLYRYIATFLLLTICGCSSNFHKAPENKAVDLSQKDFAVQPGEWGKPVQGLVSSIVVQNTNWIEPNTATVTVFIKNVSGNKVEVRPSSYFQLEKTMDPEEKKKNREAALKLGTPVEGTGCGDYYLRAITYYCPFDLNNPTITPQPNAISPLVLSVDETKQLTANLTELHWGRLIDAEWPSRLMHQAVSPSEYGLTFVMKVSSGKQMHVGAETVPGVQCIYSNELIVDLQRNK